jgi:hypothetical protein
VQIESADGDMDLVRKALATGMLLNAARLTGTSVTGDRDAGTQEYELLRGSGKSTCASADVEVFAGSAL